MNVQSQKRLLSIILVIIIVLLPSTVFGSGKVEVPTVVQTDVEIIEPVEITFWYAVSGALGDVIQKMANEFNASQDKITVVAEYSGEYVPALNKLRLAIQSKTAPNIAMTYDAGTRTMVDSNATVSIDTLKAKYPSVQIDFSDYIQSAVNYYSFDGEQFALPFCLSSPILYYNKDRFKEVGLDPDRPPKTYEEFLVAAEKLTDKSSVRANMAQVGLSGHGWLKQALPPKMDCLLIRGMGDQAEQQRCFSTKILRSISLACGLRWLRKAIISVQEETGTMEGIILLQV